jgi:N-acetylglucosaminyldiphosphoundecaprenol N-acetyl-beta-D-mannosaminyltransferase
VTDDRTLPTASILGVRVSAVNMDMAIQLIHGWILGGEHRYICCTTVDGVMEARAHEDVRRAFNSAALATPDGMPMVWISRLRGRQNVNRVYGPDLMLALCERSVKAGFRHFFYGSTPRTTQRLVERLGARFRGLQVAGWISPPFRELTNQEDGAYIDQINSTQPHILWVGLGTPKQDLWMASHVDRIRAPLMIGVGAAFDFLAGTKRQAPRILQGSGLEMVFRTLTEPRRLGPRFLRHHPLFLFLALLELAGLKRFPNEPSKASGAIQMEGP